MSHETGYSYDEECETLAAYFLGGDDGSSYTKRELRDLAQLIQDTVEGFLSDRAKPSEVGS